MLNQSHARISVTPDAADTNLLSRRPGISSQENSFHTPANVLNFRVEWAEGYGRVFTQSFRQTGVRKKRWCFAFLDKIHHRHLVVLYDKERMC